MCKTLSKYFLIEGVYIDFIDLRNNIVKEICFLTETTEEDFINYLESSK